METDLLIRQEKLIDGGEIQIVQEGQREAHKTEPLSSLIKLFEELPWS